MNARIRRLAASLTTLCLVALLAAPGALADVQGRAYVAWSTPSITVTVEPGGEAAEVANFQVDKNLRRIGVGVDSGAAQFVSAEPGYFSFLGRGQSYQLTLAIAAPADAQPGTYAGDVYLYKSRRGAVLAGRLRVEVVVEERDEQETPSPGVVALTGASPDAFNPTSPTVGFDLSGAYFGQSEDAVSLFVNGALVDPYAVSVTATRVEAPLSLVDGRNTLLLVAGDEAGRAITFEAELWAGSATLTAYVTDENGAPAEGAEVAARLGDDQAVAAASITSGGVATFFNVPDRTILLEAKASGNRFASAATTGSAGSVSLALAAFNAPSAVANNDFSLGVDGWEVGSAPVTLVEHRETISAASPGNMDLQLVTLGEGPQSISRTFVVAPGTKYVTVRYRFVTTEVPGGYFGTQYNDYYNVSIRTQSGGGVESESQSMNGLGLGAFTPGGETGWREATLPVDLGGDVVQVGIEVANVADGFYDSYVIVDLVAEKNFAVADVSLRDVDNTTLEYLSADEHIYGGGGFTLVHGTVRVQGAADDELTALDLEVLNGETVVARSILPDDLRSQVLKPFGPQGTIEVATPRLLFRIPSHMFAALDDAADGTVTLRVTARSLRGETSTFDCGPVEKLVLFGSPYDESRRYGGRDITDAIGVTPAFPCFGDDWAKPSAAAATRHFSAAYGVRWNDFSNMNGGRFPPHGSHREGADVDGVFGGYDPIGNPTATADGLIALLNDPSYGRRVGLILVTFDNVPGDAFRERVRSTVLADGRQASSVIRWIEKGHRDHFHLRFNA
jgi:hypothetical protein